MYIKEKGFHTPDDHSIVWRYMDLDKYTDLLQQGKLFFCRADNFEDPMEGILQLKDFESTREMFKVMPLTKQFYFLNCWHMNDNQSDAMWKLYTKNRVGIAIKSTVIHIKDAIELCPEPIHISSIQYRDFENVTFRELTAEPQNQIFDGFSSTNQFTYKRAEFSHERELRLYYIDRPIPHAVKGGIPRKPLEFKRIGVDLNKLVVEVFISPFAPSTFVQDVSVITERLGFSFQTTRSELYRLKG